MNLPLVRQVMPSLVANDILGVQPLSAPSGQIYRRRLRSEFEGIIMSQLEIHKNLLKSQRNAIYKDYIKSKRRVLERMIKSLDHKIKNHKLFYPEYYI